MPWLAYAHPVAMLLVLALGLWVLREGLAIRRARTLRRPHEPARHLRLARIFVPLVVLGFASGLASQGLLRGKTVLDSAHSLFASGALLGLVAGGLLGLRLQRRGGGEALRLTHSLLAAGGLLLGLGAAVAGFALLP